MKNSVLFVLGILTVITTPCVGEVPFCFTLDQIPEGNIGQYCNNVCQEKYGKLWEYGYIEACQTEGKLGCLCYKS